MSEALEELKLKLNDPMWRITSGKLYKIVTKSTGDDDDASLVVDFIPNSAQMTLIKALHTRNVILKARQLGFSTLICMMWLDTALFSKDPMTCGIIAQDKEAAEGLFTKIVFAYKNLPKEIRDVCELAIESKSEMVFSHNNSRIKVATSLRSGTIHRLHISEFGKTCAKYPHKADEVITGSIPAVPDDGVLIIESTAEGQGGDFYDIVNRAKALSDQRRPLSKRDYKFHFFPWHAAKEYVMPPECVQISHTDRGYFDKIEVECAKVLSPGQKAWYVATRDADFHGAPERMWQEYPSTPTEAFQQSMEGCYYVVEMTNARKAGRITTVAYDPTTPVNTFWDIGLNDAMAIWFHQRVGGQDRFIGYYENSGESFGHYVKEIQRRDFVLGRHYLPHDGDTRRLGTDRNWTPRQMLEELGLRNIEIIPRIDRIDTGIQMTRNAFANSWFDETECAMGIRHLDSYRKEWDTRRGVWRNEPLHDHASNGADAFRCFGQMKSSIGNAIQSSSVRVRRRNWRLI